MGAYHKAYAINAAAALAVGLALDVPIAKAVEGLAKFSPMRGRYVVLRTKNNQVLIDDAYNANPESMRAGLSSVQDTYASQKKALVLGDMKELGSLSVEAHQGIGDLCAKINPKILITVGDYSKLIASRAQEQGFPKSSCRHFSNVGELLPHLEGLLNGIEIIYIKGSFSVQLNKVVDNLIGEGR